MKNIIIASLILVFTSNSPFAQRLNNSSNSTIRYIESGRVKGSNWATIGYIEDGRVKNRSGTTIGYVEDGRVKSTSKSTFGYFEGVRRIEAVLYFFFFFTRPSRLLKLVKL